MSLRNVLLAVGAIFVFAGLGFFLIWFGQMSNRPARVETQVQNPAETRQAVLVASHTIPLGACLRKEDISSKEVGQGEAPPETLQPGQEAEFLGAISQHKFEKDDPLIESKLAKTETLAAMLTPGHRAVSISVELPPSAIGLASPCDHVDVLLTQSFPDTVTTDPARKTVGETVLRNVRVIAINRSMSPPSPVDPKMVTLELTERQAEILLVAQHLPNNPTLQLMVRPLQNDAARSEDKLNAEPVWASDASLALDEIAPPTQVSVRVYSGQPRSDGYLCSASACVPSDVTTAPRL